MKNLLIYVRYLLLFGLIISWSTVSAQSVYLVSPSNGATNVSIPTVFNWSGSDIEYYWLQVDDNSDFSSPVINNNSIYSMEFMANSLQQNTTYYWRVNGHVYDAWGGYWRGFTSTWSFTTECPRPVAPTLLTPSNGANDVALPAYFDWEDIFGIYEYEIQIDNNSDFSSVEEGYYISVSNYTASSLDENTHYFWRIRARFNNGCGWGNWGPVWSFNTECPVPDQVALTYPANNAVSLEQPLLLDWADISPVEYYHIMVDDDPYYASPEVDYSFPAGYSDYTVNGLDINTTYYWKVRAYNSCGEGGWSQSRRFTTICPLPVAPTQMTPSDEAGGLTLPIFISWSNNPNNIAYRLQVDNGLDFGDLIIDRLLGQTSSCNINSLLEQGHTYYWRIRAENDCGWSNWSAAREFSLECPLVTTPVLVDPEDNPMAGYLPAILDWDDVADASMYHIIVDDNAAFVSPVIEYEFPAGQSSYYASGLSENVTYYWKVQASNTCHESAWSEVRSFSGINIPRCGDVNLDEMINILDIIYTINYIYKFGSPPCSPR